MAAYLVSDLIARLAEIYQDNFSVVEISEIPATKDFPTSLSFNAINAVDSAGYEEVDSVNVDFSNPIVKRSISADSLCASFLFTYAELATIEYALNNALEFFKEEMTKPDCPRDLKDELKSDSIDFRNLQAKINHFLRKHIVVHK